MDRKSKQHIVKYYVNRETKKLEKGKHTWKDGVNQRAGKKLDQVIDVFKKTESGDIEVQKIDLCKRIVSCPEQLLEQFEVGYFTSNTVFTRIFDLVVKSDFPSNIQQQLEDKILILTSLKGKLQIEGVSFSSLSQNPLVTMIVDELNQAPYLDLLAERIELIDVHIEYDNNTGNWVIGMATGKGSTVWTLLPPIMMLVPFSEDDAKWSIQFLQILKTVILKCERQYTEKLVG